MMTEAEKPHVLPSASRRSRKAGGVMPSEYGGLIMGLLICYSQSEAMSLRTWIGGQCGVGYKQLVLSPGI